MKLPLFLFFVLFSVSVIRVESAFTLTNFTTNVDTTYAIPGCIVTYYLRLEEPNTLQEVNEITSQEMSISTVISTPGFIYLFKEPPVHVVMVTLSYSAPGNNTALLGVFDKATTMSNVMLPSFNCQPFPAITLVDQGQMVNGESLIRISHDITPLLVPPYVNMGIKCISYDSTRFINCAFQSITKNLYSLKMEQNIITDAMSDSWVNPFGLSLEFSFTDSSYNVLFPITYPSYIDPVIEIPNTGIPILSTFNNYDFYRTKMPPGTAPTSTLVISSNTTVTKFYNFNSIKTTPFIPIYFNPLTGRELFMAQTVLSPGQMVNYQVIWYGENITSLESGVVNNSMPSLGSVSIYSISQTIDLFSLYNVTISSLTQGFMEPEVCIYDNTRCLNTSYPFGFYKLSSSQFTKYNHYVIPALNNIWYTFDYGGTESVSTNGTAVDTLAPVVESINYKIINNGATVLVSTHITDQSGLYQIKINQLNSIVINPLEALVSGSVNDGFYMFNFTYTTSLQTITLVDALTNTFILPLFCSDPELNRLQPAVPLNIDDITLLKFIPSIVDLSTSGATVTFGMNVTNPNPLKTYSLELYLPLFALNQDYTPDPLKYINCILKWDPKTLVYRCDFKLPPRMQNGTIGYVLDNTYSNNLIKSARPDFPDSQLLTYSTSLDQIAPYVTNITAYPSDIVHPLTSTVNVGFTIKLYDQPAGLDYSNSYIVIYSDQDGLPITIYFSPSNRISGDQFVGIYRLTFQVNGLSCVGQQLYTIKKLVLTDTIGYKSVYPVSKDYDPLFFVAKLSFSSYSFAVICTTVSISDYEAPILTQFQVDNYGEVDLGSTYRNIFISMKTYDGVSGISPQHNPVVYVHGVGDTMFSADPVKVTPSGATSTYTYEIELPFPFYADSIVTFSVYGLVDNQKNIRGYTTSELKEGGFSYYLNATFSSFPIIQSTSDLYDYGGVLTIYGRGFYLGITTEYVSVDYHDGRGFIQHPVVSKSPIYVTFYVSAVTQSSIDIQYFYQIDGLVESNVFTVTRSSLVPRSFIPPTIPCPGNCNNHGSCTPNGCSCTLGWTGPDCMATSVPSTDPSVNPTQPAVVTSSLATDLTSFISIYSIREIGFNNDILEEYQITNYTTSNLTTSSSHYQYLYKTQFGPTNNTQFNVSIEWFSNYTVIPFAGDSIKLDPYAIKLTLNLSSYQFQSYLSTLQIVMDVAINTNNQDNECTSKEYGVANGNSNNLQWLKLKLDGSSFFGQFARRAVLDGRVVSITNSILDKDFNPSSTSSSTRTFIGINIPQYRQSALIDPDFSTLIDNNSHEGEDQTCKGGNKKKLTANQIIGIVIGCIAAVLVASLVTYYILKKRYRLVKHGLSIKLVPIS